MFILGIFQVLYIFLLQKILYKVSAKQKLEDKLHAVGCVFKCRAQWGCLQLFSVRSNQGLRKSNLFLTIHLNNLEVYQ